MNRENVLKILKPAAGLLFIIYLSVLLYIVFFAWNYGSSFHQVGEDGRNYNLIPFLSIYRIGMFSPSLMDPLTILGGNILLFIPYGFFLSVLYHNRSGSKKTAFLVIGSGAVLSVFIEINQYFFTYRVANVDDVILNVLGVIIGYSFCRWIKPGVSTS